MKLCCWRTAIVLFFYFFILVSSSHGRNNNVLIINSYTEEYRWSEYVFDAIRSKIVDKAPDIKIYSESLNVLLLMEEKELEERKQKVLDRVESNPPEVIILQGNFALLAFLDELHTIWKGIPVILCADDKYVPSLESYFKNSYLSNEEDFPLDELVKGLNITIVNCPVYIKETIQVMQRLLPEMKKLVFISDRRYISVRIRHKLEEELKRDFPNLELSQLVEGEITTEMMLDSIRSCDIKSVGILYYSWVLGKEGHAPRYVSTSNYRLVANVTSHPVFTLMDIGVHTDEMVGGYFYCGYEMGETVASLLETVTSGAQPSAVRWCEAGKPRYTFCYNVLQAAGIPSQLYPKDAVYYFAPESFWMRNRYAFVGFGILLALLGLMYMRLRWVKKVAAYGKRK